MKYIGATLFSKNCANRQELARLGSKSIITLSSLWSRAPHRDPHVSGRFQLWAHLPEKCAFRPEEIATDTGLDVSRFHSPQVIGAQYEIPEHQRTTDRFATSVPDLVGLCTGKRPAFVSFCDAGYGNRPLFMRSMALAAALASSGYFGRLDCRSDAIKYVSENPEKCVVSLNEDGRIAVRVHWGQEELVGALIDFCRAEKFLEEDGREEWERPRKTA